MIFHGKNVVVTGGANGIGLAISRNIAAAGGSVWIFDLECENPAEAARSIGSQACIADVTYLPSLESAFDEAGVPDVVVVNAGSAGPRPYRRLRRIFGIERWP
jgi:NAD(P)-dependent dehydrogenase (short-subunit alcohol dehydrogenase family)